MAKETGAVLDPGPSAQPQQPPKQWSRVFGQMGTAPWEACGALQDRHTQAIPAALLADQSKAFERLSHSWLRLVMTKWALPPWATASTQAPGTVG